MVTSNDFPPTDQDEIVRKYLSKEIDEKMSEYKKLIKEDLKSFNKEFSETIGIKGSLIIRSFALSRLLPNLPPG